MSCWTYVGRSRACRARCRVTYPVIFCLRLLHGWARMRPMRWRRGGRTGRRPGSQSYPCVAGDESSLSERNDHLEKGNEEIIRENTNDFILAYGHCSHRKLGKDCLDHACTYLAPMRTPESEQIRVRSEYFIKLILSPDRIVEKINVANEKQTVYTAS